MSRARKLAFALLAGMAVLVLVELGLSLVVPLPAPFECRPGPAGTRLCAFTRNRYRTPIAVPKPPSTYRIMIFGESAVEGWLELGFPAWLGEMARAAQPPLTVEIINLGMSGVSTTLIRDWFFPALDLQPDLVVLYLGNNDLDSYPTLNPAERPLAYGLTNFLARHSRLYVLLKTVAGGFTTSPNPDAEADLKNLAGRARTPDTERRLAQVNKLYRQNLEDMTRAAKARGIKVILMSPAANLRDWPPLNPSPAPGLSPDQIARIDREIADAQSALKLSNLVAARAALARALDLDPTHAQAHFLLAQVLEREQDSAGAYEHYRLARKYDASLLRAPTGFAAIGGLVADRNGERFIDLDRRLHEKSASGIPGFDLYFDYLHFNLRGNYEVAAILFSELARAGDLTWGRPEVPPAAEVRVRLYTNDNEAIAKMLEAAFVTRFSAWPEMAAQAERLLKEAAALRPDDSLPLLYSALLAASRGDEPVCRERLNAAYRLSPEAASATARRFFPRALEIYQGQAVIVMDSARNWAGLANARRGWAAAALPPLRVGTIPLRSARLIFRWTGDSGFQKIGEK